MHMYIVHTYEHVALYVHVILKVYMYSTCLHGDREVSLGLWREVDIDGFLGEGLVARGWGSNLNDVKLIVQGKEIKKY